MSGRPADPESRDDSEPGILRLGTPGLADLMRGILAEGRSVRFRAGGSSMRPHLRDGDIVLIGPVARPYEIGDVAAFAGSPEGALLIHRLVGIQDAAFRFKGDSAKFFDPPVPRDDVFGIVLSVERRGRSVRSAGRKGKRLAARLSRVGFFAAILSAGWKAKRLLGRRRTDA
ncbi:MAG: S24/S26 family peptidase [Candidatus Aminicenantes bacterium]|nr:S24/S26 family peptidase [Candidatus Aminicenantes bacterium]